MVGLLKKRFTDSRREYCCWCACAPLQFRGHLWVVQLHLQLARTCIEPNLACSRNRNFMDPIWKKFCQYQVKMLGNDSVFVRHIVSHFSGEINIGPCMCWRVTIFVKKYNYLKHLWELCMNCHFTRNAKDIIKPQKDKTVLLVQSSLLARQLWAGIHSSV